MPSCVPSAATRRTSRALIRSLILVSLAPAAAMRHPLLGIVPFREKGQASEATPALGGHSTRALGGNPVVGWGLRVGRGPASRFGFVE